jgi:hypothetical protein
MVSAPLSVAIDHDGVVGDAEVVELFQQGAHHLDMFHHAVGVKPERNAGDDDQAVLGENAAGKT